MSFPEPTGLTGEAERSLSSFDARPPSSAESDARVLELFHPVLRTWFERRFPHGATPAQAAGWPAIARGEHTLIAAPTGSGKTLSAFLVCIDRL